MNASRIGPVPYDAETERAVLAAMLLSERAGAEVLDLLNDEDFYVDAHRRVFAAYRRVVEAGRRPDVVTVGAEMKVSGTFDAVGGTVFLSGLMDAVLTSSGCAEHAGIVRDLRVRREVLSSLAQLQGLAKSEGVETGELLNRFQTAAAGVHQLTLRSGRVQSWDAVLRGFVETHEKRRKMVDGVTGIPTGFRGLDTLTSGFQPSDVIVVGGWTSSGKSALVEQMVMSAAESGFPVSYISLEMSAGQMADRMLSRATGTNILQMRRGRVDESRLAAAVSRQRNLPIFIDDVGDATAEDVVAGIRTNVLQHNVKLVVLDYIQNLKPSPGLARDPRVNVSQAARLFKAVAKRLNINVMIVSQLRRPSDPQSGREPVPTMHHLMESGAIEQNADLILLLHRKNRWLKDMPVESGVRIMLVKQRNGPPGTVEASFTRMTAEFSDVDNLAAAGYNVPDGTIETSGELEDVLGD